MHKISSPSTDKILSKLAIFVHKAYGWYLRNSFVIYQPRIQGNLFLGGVRSTVDRWGFIKKEIGEKSSILDIGCGEGFFTLLTARDLGCVSFGIDVDERRLSFAHYQLLSQKIFGAGFVHAECTTEFISKLPQFDYIIFLSVFHHITARYGVDSAKLFLEELRLHTKIAMFFETGLSTENTRTTSKIPSMGHDHLVWITEMLLSAGWSRVEVLGESLSYAKDALRPVLKVYP